ncbi:helix-turn-helix transcriptional regulator [Streptomyces sp. LBUM 1476]|uniref:Helix-turn-helix domain-containing protein n=1 Tax=Streptomyces acidiscabies TaxID=42234 RepID=A0AAP6EJD3_9ACTN|nr:helix-turn-helix domain-containing protein [Streptomyces acidiscabies]MBP5935348.1 helix-turn-helix transcriptional regulator [Streptomyces sp. LBUM 1476]MBZ3916815.1 helix-turn-helix transcriptional regulator [Streptomyces acidiscabies]MDX2964416.1 helix-turn-helix domain-containing protein [Streptomyces acidiscabies]MDX3022965.1 helix-turn-helix domain-containing protein [Streptomyces acidiscabies]MDX3794239.1 helix-turn-helix domain-containing protein [Streptomyces acidiscabies]
MWLDPDVRNALGTWDFGSTSRLIRLRSGLRQEDMAHLTGLSQAFLSMLEKGNRRLTNIDKIIEFLTGLDVPVGLIALPLPQVPASVVQEHTAQFAGDADPSLPWTAARMVAALDIAVGGREMDRRRLLTASGVALTAFVNAWDAAEAEPLQRAAEGSRLTHDLLDGLQRTTDNLRTMDASDGSGTLTSLSNRHLQFLKHLLEETSYDEARGRRLAAIIADTAAQTGWFVFDSGDRDRPLSYLYAALRAAKVSQDVRLGAGALSYIAIHGYSTGAPHHAVTAAQRARDKVRKLDTPALEAMLLTRQARGHAKLGERQAALAALGRAAELCSQGRSEHDPHWLYWINEGEIHGQAGSCYLDLGDPRNAVASFMKARETHNPAEHRTRGLFLSRAATAHIEQGDLEAGCATAHEVLDLSERLQSARLDSHVTSMIQQLRTVAHSPYAQDVLERHVAMTTPGSRT